MKIAELELDGVPVLNTLHKMSEGLEKFEGQVKSFAAGFAGLGLIYETFSRIAEGFEKVLNMGAKLEAMHLATGASVHDLVIFGHALDTTGGSAESAQSFIFKLQNAIAGVNEDGKNTATALKLLGTSAEELRSAPLLEQVEKISAGLAKIPDQATKVAVIKDLFGFRFAQQAMPLLSNPEALESAKEHAEGLASVMDRNAEKFHELEAAMKGFSLNIQTFFAGALEGLAPDATSLADALGRIDFVGIGRAVGQMLDVFLKLAEVLMRLAPLLNSVSGALSHMPTDAFRAAAAGGATGALVGSVLPGVGTVFGAAAGASAGFLGGLFFGRKDKPAEHHGFANAFHGLFDSPGVKDSPVGHLQKIGLGGGFGLGGSDPLLNESQRQTRLLESIDAKLGAGKEGNIPGLSFPAV